MSTVVYRNARFLIDGYEFSAQLNEMTLNYSAEMLDQTTFGNDTRIKQGGLMVHSLQAKGFAAFGASAIANILFGDLPTDDIVVTVFPDTIVEGGGAGDVGTGYMMKGTLDTFDVGGAVGTLLGLTINVTGRNAT